MINDYSYDAILEEVQAFRNAVNFQVHGFEDLHDMDRYVETALDQLGIPVEFQGTITVTFEYKEYVDSTS